MGGPAAGVVERVAEGASKPKTVFKFKVSSTPKAAKTYSNTQIIPWGKIYGK